MAYLPGIGITYTTNLISISFLHTVPELQILLFTFSRSR